MVFVIRGIKGSGAAVVEVKGAKEQRADGQSPELERSHEGTRSLQAVRH